MAENQTQTKPQFILWVKEAGVFRPAQLKMPENFLGYDLERNVELGSQDISPDSLNLMNSVYLGPINIFEEQLGNVTSKDVFQRLREHKHGIACEIENLAEEVAKRQGVPYFAVNIVRTGKNRTWKFTEKDDFLLTLTEYVEREIKSGFVDKLYKPEKKYDLVDKLYKPEKPLEFVLHPTAQLYVPRK